MTIRAYQHDVQVLGGVVVVPEVKTYQHTVQVLGGAGPVALNYVSTGSVLLNGTSNALLRGYLTYSIVKVRFKVD